jgi:hypothetical protein
VGESVEAVTLAESAAVAPAGAPARNPAELPADSVAAAPAADQVAAVAPAPDGLPEAVSAEAAPVAAEVVAAPQGTAPDPAPDAGAPRVATAVAPPSPPGAEAGPVLAALPQAPATGPRPAAPRVLLADDRGVRVLQPGGAPEVQEVVAIDSIAYDTAGAVILAGRGRPDSYVRIYIDNSEVITAASDADGQWRTDLPDVDRGVYTLRVDEVDKAGKVKSRAETPFQREDPVEIAAANPEAAPGPGEPLRVIVQPGNTIWGIARRDWGEGILYVRVWEANKDRIRNPDLIYPGQIFDMPEGATE